MGMPWHDSECHRKEPPALPVRVKTGGKSSRGGMVTCPWDKPCGLKCHVYPGLLLEVEWHVLLETVGRGRQIEPGRELWPR